MTESPRYAPLKAAQSTYWTDFLAGVGKLTGQTKIEHIAAPAGAG